MTRLIVFTSAFAIAATAAMAGDSVIHIKTGKSENRSVRSFSCSECPDIKPRFVSPDVHGVEVIEQHVDGQKKIVQMDNMMGGSAVRIVKAGAEPENYAGESVVRENGGTLVTDNQDDATVIQPGQQPVMADGSVTYEGGGEFKVDEEPVQDGVDDGSQTSSVESLNMNDAEHHNVNPDKPVNEEPHNNGPEIIELRTNN